MLDDKTIILDRTWSSADGDIQLLKGRSVKYGYVQADFFHSLGDIVGCQIDRLVGHAATAQVFAREIFDISSQLLCLSRRRLGSARSLGEDVASRREKDDSKQ